MATADVAPATADNGIVVWKLKEYDERTLRLQLDNVWSLLSKTSLVDASNLAVGNFQGAAARAATNDWTVTGPAPATSAAVPTASGQISPLSFSPSYGISGTELLSQQMELQYRAINLQLLLERSLTDRLRRIDEKTGDFQPRSQPVIGFNVSINPQCRGCEYRQAVAEVEVTVRSDQPDPEKPFVVAMMPQSNTYNVVALQQEAHSVGLGVVIGSVGGGFKTGGASQTLYLVKDVDTVALEEPSPEEDTVRFVWQFRPVLGQTSVQPGTRQVFAVLGLPASAFASHTAPWKGHVTVHTRWRQMGKDGISVGDLIPQSGSPKPDLEDTLTIYPATDGEEHLQAIRDIIIENLGGGKVAVVVLGAFENGTQVNIGDKILDTPDRGLLVSSPERIKFVASTDDLVRNTPILVDRYGLGVQVVDRSRCDGKPGLTAKPDLCDITSIDATTCRVNLEVTMPGVLDAEPASEQPWHTHRPVLDMGGQVFWPHGEGEKETLPSSWGTSRLSPTTFPPSSSHKITPSWCATCYGTRPRTRRRCRCPIRPSPSRMSPSSPPA